MRAFPPDISRVDTGLVAIANRLQQRCQLSTSTPPLPAQRTPVPYVIRFLCCRQPPPSPSVYVCFGVEAGAPVPRGTVSLNAVCYDERFVLLCHLVPVFPVGFCAALRPPYDVSHQTIDRDMAKAPPVLDFGSWTDSTGGPSALEPKAHYDKASAATQLLCHSARMHTAQKHHRRDQAETPAPHTTFIG
ncbi:hypothetical protein CRENBAI_022350 [Crenichthys baileyi]|uniref:Uncharacterized protein n=1 Tax=Crenichthys baileyi TaxID=28760 RepID=A0AAV9RM58_9TELE